MLVLISNKGETLPLVYRLRKEGLPVEIYLHDLAHGRNYAGIMAKTGLGDLEDAVKRAEIICVDTILRNKKTPRDLAFFEKFKLSQNTLDVFGQFADKLRRPPWDKMVIGPTEEVAVYELNRPKGLELAKKAGFAIPAYHEFKSLKEAAKFLESKEGQAREKWFFKASGNLALDLTQEGTPQQLIDYLTNKVARRLNGDAVDAILQEAIEGECVELSRELWKNPEGKAENPNSTFEDKKLASRVGGPRVGSAVNLVWRDSDAKGIIHREILNIFRLLGNYVGPIDANCRITYDRRAKRLIAWFLEWSLRFGYSAVYLLLTFIVKGKLSNFFLEPFKTSWRKGFVASQALSLYPFPPTDNNRADFIDMIQGNLITEPLDRKDFWWLDVYQDADGKLRVGGTDGLIGVGCHHAETLQAAIEGAFDLVDSINIMGNKNMWPLREHLDSHLERYEKLQEWGIIS